MPLPTVEEPLSPRTCHVGLTVVLVALSVTGVVSVGAASDGVSATLWIRHLVWVLLGWCAHMSMAALDYRRWGDWPWAAYTIVLLLLLTVLLIDNSIAGVNRWLPLGPLTLQPAEFAKPVLIAVLSLWISETAAAGARRRRVLAGAAVIAGAPVLLVRAQPALGTACVLAVCAAAIVMLECLSRRALLVLVLIGLDVLALGFWAVRWHDAAHPEAPLEPRRILQSCGLRAYQADRIASYLAGLKDIEKGGWAERQARIAMGRGGLWGAPADACGPLVLGFMPRKVAPSDYAFAMFAGRRGFAGGCALLLAYGYLLLAVARLAGTAADVQGRCLGIGVWALLLVHVVEPVAMTLGLTPVTGVPMPLVSYGGSFTVSVMAALGCVHSVWRYRDCPPPKPRFTVTGNGDHDSQRLPDVRAFSGRRGVDPGRPPEDLPSSTA